MTEKFNNMFYFAVPTSWTTPTTSNPGTVNWSQATSGGGGGFGTDNGWRPLVTSYLSNGGSGGDSTQILFSNLIIPAKTGGLGAIHPAFGPNGINVGDGIGEITVPIHLDQNYFKRKSFLSDGGNGAVGGNNNNILNYYAGPGGGKGGSGLSIWNFINIQTNTVYPISIGQAGAGGGGGAGGGVGGQVAGGSGGNGGGPNGGSGASWGPAIPGGNGGLIPFSFLNQNGNPGGVGANGNNHPSYGTGGGGGGGGTGVHSYMIFYYND
jgi:hypothetical protein